MNTPVNTTRWSLVLIATMAGIATAFNVGKIPPAIPLIQQELSLTLSQIGWVVSSYSGLAMLLSLPMGILGTKIGHYRLALLALALLAIGSLSGSYATTLPILLAARITEGFGFVMIAVTAPALIAMVVKPKDRAMAMAVWAVWMPVGISLMLLTSPSIIAASGWRNVWLLTGVIPLLWFFILGISFWRTHKKNYQPATQAKPEIRSIFRRDTLLIAASFTCFSAIFLVSVSFTPTVWNHLKGITLQYGSYLLALAIASNIIGNLIGGWFIARGYALSRVLLASFIIPACLAGLTFVDTLPFWLQYLCLASFIFIGGIVPGAIFSAAPAYASSPAQIGLIIGLLFQGAALGQVIGPILFSRLIELVGGDWSWGLLFYITFALLGGLLMSQIRPPSAHQSPPAT